VIVASAVVDAIAVEEVVSAAANEIKMRGN